MNGAPRFGIIVGGRFDGSKRAAIARNEQPRVDVFEMEAALPAELYDFAWLEERARSEWLTGLVVKTLGKRFGLMSEALALRLLFQARDHQAFFATGEDVGLSLGVLLRFVPGRPRLVMRVESLQYGRTRARRAIYRSFVRLASASIDAFVCRTHAYERYLEDELGVSRSRIAFAPEPVDTRFFDRSNLAGERPDFVPAGPFFFAAGLELRDYDTLVQAARGLDVPIVIASGSPWSHDSYGLEAGEKPVNVQVRRFTQAELRELYARALAVVVPLRPSIRSCGISVVNEAARMRCPVVASRTEGLMTYVDDGQSGFFVPPGDAAALREALKAILSDREKLAALTERAYERTSERAPLEKYVEHIGRLLRARE
ncbi:MAG TPA: glycosyltransferase family 4 protein [Polyangiaceae bacterium]